MFLLGYFADPKKRLVLGVTLMSVALLPTALSVARAQSDGGATDGGVLTLRSDVQEANSITGVVTARGNVRIDYPARQIQATSAQAQYFSEERRIVLSGNVLVLQEGNSLQAETVTYLIDEGRFVALPQPDQQVEANYILPEPETPTGSSGRAASPPSTLDISPIPAPDASVPEAEAGTEEPGNGVSSP